jgi:hypothetical protein
MNRLTIENAQPLNARLRNLGPETIIGFPGTRDNRVIKMKAFAAIGDSALFSLLDVAHATVDDELPARFPKAGWPVGLRRDGAIADWHTLREYDYPNGKDLEWDSPVLKGPRKKQFATQFNALMHTAADEGWLLGIGRWVDNSPPGDFGQEPPMAQVHRILLPPTPGTVGLRETIGGGYGAEQALQSAVRALGILGMEGAS